MLVSSARLGIRRRIEVPSNAFFPCCFVRRIVRYFYPPPNPPNRALENNINDFDSFEHADQTWVLMNRAPTRPAQDNTYVAYDNSASGDVGAAAGELDGPDMRVAVSYGRVPP